MAGSREHLYFYAALSIIISENTKVDWGFCSCRIKRDLSIQINRTSWFILTILMWTKWTFIPGIQLILPAGYWLWRTDVLWSVNKSGLTGAATNEISDIKKEHTWISQQAVFYIRIFFGLDQPIITLIIQTSLLLITSIGCLGKWTSIAGGPYTAYKHERQEFHIIIEKKHCPGNPL